MHLLFYAVGPETKQRHFLNLNGAFVYAVAGGSNYGAFRNRQLANDNNGDVFWRAGRRLVSGPTTIEAEKIPASSARTTVQKWTIGAIYESV